MAGRRSHSLEFNRRVAQDFLAMIPHISLDNPMSCRRSTLAYYGAKDLQQKRQIGIPLVVNTIRRGELKTLFVRYPDEFMV